MTGSPRRLQELAVVLRADLGPVRERRRRRISWLHVRVHKRCIRGRHLGIVPAGAPWLPSSARISPARGAHIGTHPGNDLAHRRSGREDLRNAHLCKRLPVGVWNDATAKDDDVVGVGLVQ
jgi:hypothetical protein